MYKLCVLVFLFLLSGCESRTTLAPVVELNWRSPSNHQNVHIVRRGDTLYSIAFRYDKDYRELAAFNHLPSPYALKVGQVLRIGAASAPKRHFSRWVAPQKQRYVAKRTTIKREPSKNVLRATWTPANSNQHWVWPVNGRVATGFIPQQGKKGIDIAGKKGEKIRAASSGVVAYSGSGLSGYGNLIIIKHNNQFLTAYGNNLHNLVKEGQSVKAGQIIAEMGVIDRRFWGVHFEIRRAGKPVNPLSYLGRG
ncbi:peptidoglycan DD-metalloendopeptidase family protein [Legionella cardiaca]|uniref:Peptidoglycan DD-metalloendopeptidase family protein n=1 Tax=Legionella cardiaca TaxID=1071983 RepID=A0ABY8ATP6_9GAMM|nr:peptidoglycan DD-metalloendopeptidase family protein [Legionella cardiaca]WED44055.1 peptidoglycan DD-metalloendopeptidase family protein [Legionella cardiaca]